MKLSATISARALNALALMLISCGSGVAGATAIPDTPRAHVTFLPASGVPRSEGAQEVMRAPLPGDAPIGRLHAPRLGASRMVLAGTGLPLPVSGPGHLFLSPNQSAPGSLLMLAEPEAAPGFIERFGSGDPLVLELTPGRGTRFRVTRVHLVADPAQGIATAEHGGSLTLVTRIPPVVVGEPSSWYIVIAKLADRVNPR